MPAALADCSRLIDATLAKCNGRGWFGKQDVFAAKKKLAPDVRLPAHSFLLDPEADIKPKRLTAEGFSIEPAAS